MTINYNDSLGSGKRFVLGMIESSRLEIDFFNLYAWLLKFVSGKKVLDIACGSGLGSFLMAHKAKEVWGVDISEESIGFAQKHYQFDNLKFFLSDALKFDLPKSYFDVIVCAMTIEQISSEFHKEFLLKLKKSLLDEGMIILVTTNKKINAPFSRKKAGNPLNQNEFHKRSLVKLINSVNLKPDGWYGRRRVHIFFANYLSRFCINLIQKLTSRNFGLYGKRERPSIMPVNFFWQPKDFVVILKKIN